MEAEISQNHYQFDIQSLISRNNRGRGGVDWRGCGQDFHMRLVRSSNERSLTSNTLRISLQLLIIIVFCFTCGGCTESLMQNEHSEFMIGKWQATQIGYDIYGNYFEEIFIKFSRNGRLLYCRKRPIESFCSFFDYTFLDENLILVKNRRFKSGEWTLSRSGDNLLMLLPRDSLL